MNRKQAPAVLDKYIDLYIDRPRCCWASSMLFLVLIVGISVGTKCIMLTPEQKSAWSVHQNEFTETWTAYQKAEAMLAGSEGSAKEETHRFSIFYKAGSGDTLFTPECLRDICRFETPVLLATLNAEVFCPGFGNASACPLLSPLSVFYGDSRQAARNNCPLLSQASVDATVARMVTGLAADGTSTRYAPMLSRSFEESSRSLLTQSIYEIAANTKEDAAEFLEEKVYSQFSPPQEYGFMKSVFAGDADQMVQFHSVRIRYYIRSNDIQRMTPNDLYFASGAVAVVFFAMWFHLKSSFLASCAMWQILASLPFASLLYTKIFMVEYFAFIHVLVVYLMLGIGADNVFVLQDAWAHFKQELGIGWGAADRDTMHRALKSAWIRTSGAVFNTSFTTMAAFMSMSVSKVMPMVTCGYYTAICVVLNYLLTITFAPGSLMLHQLYFGGKRCFCPNPRAPVRTEQAAKGNATTPEAGTPEAGAEVKPSGMNIVEHTLCRVYLPLMLKRVGPIKPVPLLSVLVMASVAIQGAIFTSRLTPPTKDEVWFPPNHMRNNIHKFSIDNFYTTDVQLLSPMWFVWGIKGINFADFNRYRPDDFPGELEFDDSFDLSTRSAQQAFLRTCQEVCAIPCIEVGCTAEADGLVLKHDSQHVASCFLEDFQRWMNATQNTSELPTGPAFYAKLQDFRNDPSSPTYAHDFGKMLARDFNKEIGFIDGRLRYAVIGIRSNMPSTVNYAAGIRVRDHLVAFVKEQMVAMPESMGSLKLVCQRFSWLDLSVELISGLFTGVSIGGPLVFMVLLLSTRNVCLAFYAVLSVASIVVSVLGFCKSAMDYDLGIGEAIAGVIVIGYSVDYVLHMAHIYCEAAEDGIQTCEERAAFVIRNMGTTVVAAAATTAGAGAVMFFCYLTFFFKMAILICLTIGFSFLYSFLMFMGLCFMIGPEGRCGDITPLFTLLCPRRPGSVQSAEEKEEDGGVTSI